ncbi:MAG: rod shape-determining protein MreC [Flavobacteriales bacterium]|nr:rod shape-determining protein MreC [Flavobacteriales bacterium]
MQNLIRLIWKYRNTFLFVFLEIVALILIIKSNNYHQNNFYTNYLEIAGYFYDKEHSFYSYFKLKDDNEQLIEENSKLLSQADFSLDIKARSALMFKDSMYNLQYEYLPAKVINITFNRKKNFLLLNQGSNHGVRSEMGVIFNESIVGVVKDVSANFCNVQSIMNEKLQISAQIKRSNYLGRLNWDHKNGDQFITLNDIPNHADVSIGDTVVTKGASGIFPEGICVGSISSIDPIEGIGFLNIQVKFDLDYRRLSNCYIVKNVFKEETDALMDKMDPE